MDGFINKLRSLDAYPKINEDFYRRTLSGGVITLVSSVVMLLLFISELRLYLHAVTETKLVVDTSRGETLRINFDVTFAALPCSILSLDAMDISGEQHLDVKHDIIKKRLDAHGNVIESRQDGIGAPKIEKPLQRHGGRLEHNETYCGSCYGAETSDEECCNSCEDVREAYRKKGWGMSNPDVIDQCKREGFLQRIKDEEGEGCNIYGFLEVNKVAGNFHFAPGKSFYQSGVHVHDLLAFQKDSFNISHKINRLTFGDYFPGVVNPLDGVLWTHQTPSGMYQYFIKVVPTVYTDVSGHTIQSNQFSVTEHFISAEQAHFQALPGVFFFYDLSPIKVGFSRYGNLQERSFKFSKIFMVLELLCAKFSCLILGHGLLLLGSFFLYLTCKLQVTFTEEHISFLHFLTNVCAIIGGVFTVSGILDSFIYHGHRAIKKKMEIGKFS
ncbi:endoplasmic reticulum-Golgi intermediate compartment protein 3-like isoform X1 [Juglans regia]|uniref:Endoplasmic reticulum-Golgi intermediate compartment protein 3-like isoform X1 n=1 Tax=Juglans regia TaxID=51240 RepID=A0A6P9F2Q9_JUGRE|nr:endoplasmic reticulum-Golgi intermediate compartment protein 3-like isoform X1 [Juglans regia]